MASSTNSQIQEKKIISPTEKQRNVENHKKITTHLETALRHHTEEAKHHENEHCEKAAISNVKTNKHLYLANQ